MNFLRLITSSVPHTVLDRDFFTFLQATIYNINIGEIKENSQSYRIASKDNALVSAYINQCCVSAVEVNMGPQTTL